MKQFLLGHDCESGTSVYFPKSAYRTHAHFLGGTGKGKTTCLLTLQQALLKDPHDSSCHINIDFLGGWTSQLLLWMSSRWCPQRVRDRLILIRPSREDVVLGFNPLLYGTLAEGYYRVAHAVETVLRGWDNQDISTTPRLARWLFNSFWAAAQLGLTISDCVHLLHPGSSMHRLLLGCLPEKLRADWRELLDSRNSQAAVQLESARNRLNPFFESPLLCSMFGSTTNRLDIARFQREGKIVLIDLQPLNRLPPQIADTFAGMVLNEIFATARSTPPSLRRPTYLWLDEFQRMTTPDLLFAIPEVRQLDVRLLLSHQSMCQLKQGNVDLTSIIFQPQTRFVFGNQGEDADLIAAELASIGYDPKKVKDEVFSRRQMISGHRIIELASWSDTTAMANNWSKSEGKNWSAARSEARRPGEFAHLQTNNRGDGGNQTSGQGGSESQSRSAGGHQSLVPEYEQFMELASRTYYTFEEQKQLWAQAVRTLCTGSVVLRQVDDATLRTVDVKRDAPGHLSLGREKLEKKYPELLDAEAQLIEENFRQEFFVSPSVIERETQERLDRVLRPRIEIHSSGEKVPDDENESFN